jgi:hypothetical protein
MKKPRKTETKKYVKPELVELVDPINIHGACAPLGSGNVAQNCKAGLIAIKACSFGTLEG